jgi:hypothetical protein
MVVALVLYARMSEGWDGVSMAASCCLFIMNAKAAHYNDSLGKPSFSDLP